MVLRCEVRLGMISRLPEMPKNPVFSRVCGLLAKRQMYRNLSQSGVISHRNGVETHVLAGRRGHGFLLCPSFLPTFFPTYESVKILIFRKRR